MNAIAFVLHLVAAVVWIGGMFFAYIVLRPSLGNYDPARRLNLWLAVFKRFFPWVWMAILFLLTSGYWLLFNQFGGFATSPGYVHFMQLTGLIMIGLFVYLYYLPYPLFKSTTSKEDWPAASVALNRIRHIILINLVLGIVLLAGVGAGRYL